MSSCLTMFKTSFKQKSLPSLKGTKDSCYHPISSMHCCMNLYRYAGPKALILERCIGRTRDASSFGLPCSESIFSSSSALPSHHRELSLVLSSAYSSLHRMSVITSNYSIGDRRCQMGDRTVSGGKGK